MRGAGSMELLERLARHATDSRERVAVHEVAGERSITYGELYERAKSFAERLREVVAPGSVVMQCAPNVMEFHVAFFGVLLAGCSVFPFSPDAVEPELVRAAEKSGAAAVIGSASVLGRLRGRVRVLVGIDEMPMASETGLRRNERLGQQDLLLQTSGTTGMPGIVQRSIAAVDAVAKNMVEAIGFGAGDRVLSTVPLCHSYGIEHGLLAPMLAGSTVNLCRSFNLAAVIEALEKLEITIFPAVPSIWEMIGRLAPSEAAFRALRVAYSAGSVLPLPVSEMVLRRFGVRIGQVYGATEVGSVTFNDPAAAEFDPMCAGRGLGGVTIRTMTSSGVPAMTGTEANVHVSAPSMFRGYLGGDGSEIRDGFFATGDVGRLSSSGQLTVTGRVKLLIDVGGLKVNPTEVEQMLLEHPAVAECVVIPVPLTETVNRLKALIIPRFEQQPPAADELTRFARARLTAYKVPRIFEIRHSLPRTATGKVLRHLIEA